MCRMAGFTLVEILLAMAIVSVIILSVYYAQKQVYAIATREDDFGSTYRQVRLLTELLRSELSMTYLPVVSTSQDENDLLEGSESYFVLRSFADQTVELIFCTMTPSWSSSYVEAHLMKVCYRFVEGQESGDYTLIRSEQPYAGEKAIGLATEDIILDDLSQFTLEVFDVSTGDWKDSYEVEDRLPSAIRMSLVWAKNGDRPEMSFSQTIIIPAQGTIQISGQ